MFGSEESDTRECLVAKSVVLESLCAIESCVLSRLWLHRGRCVEGVWRVVVECPLWFRLCGDRRCVIVAWC